MVVFFFLVASELEGNIFHWKELGEGESKPDIFVDNFREREEEFKVDSRFIFPFVIYRFSQG